MELEEGDEIIAQLEIELQSLPKDQKIKKGIQIRTWKAELSRWKSDVVSFRIYPRPFIFLMGRAFHEENTPCELRQRCIV
jgi:hypothetical protein